ncbi:MAG: hypothetical protein QOG85_2105 [Gaiellaceae bacterium]|jgi:hypothetical protein|nr:hypothetical protein [Gaiellaceae bacterium]
MTRGLLALAVIAFALAGCGSSGSVSVPCSPKPGGALCLKLVRSDGKVRDVIAYRAGRAPQLRGMNWRLDVGVGRLSYSGPIRHDDPALASEYASHGDFPGLHLPVGEEWLVCVGEEIRSVGGRWSGRWLKKPKPACGMT